MGHCAFSCAHGAAGMLGLGTGKPIHSPFCVNLIVRCSWALFFLTCHHCYCMTDSNRRFSCADGIALSLVQLAVVPPMEMWPFSNMGGSLESHPPPWRCWRPGWMGLRAVSSGACFSGWHSCSGQRGGFRWSLRFLSTQPILWFCDCKVRPQHCSELLWCHGGAIALISNKI